MWARHNEPFPLLADLFRIGFLFECFVILLLGPIDRLMSLVLMQIILLLVCRHRGTQILTIDPRMISKIRLNF